MLLVNGLDFEVKEMALLFCFVTEALHGALSNMGWHCQRLLLNIWQSLPELIKCSGSWHCQVLEVFA